EVIEMVRTHHERWDGTGYPRRLAGLEIPLYGRIAAIVDCFDAMTTPRPWAAARSRHQALQEIYSLGDAAFQGELVEQFISCLGAFPTGSLVELSNGQVAVVMMQNPSRRLRPRVMLLTDSCKRLLESFEPVDLMDQPEELPLSEPLNVVCGLPVRATGLHPAVRSLRPAPASWKPWTACWPKRGPTVSPQWCWCGSSACASCCRSTGTAAVTPSARPRASACPDCCVPAIASTGWGNSSS